MKDQKSSIFTTLLMAIILVVAGACHEDDSDWGRIPVDKQEAEPITVKDAIGTLYYSQEGKQWRILFEYNDWGDSIWGHSWGNEDAPIVVVKNMNDNYKKLQGKVRISGEMKMAYKLYPKDAAGTTIVYFFDFDISEISPLQQ